MSFTGKGRAAAALLLLLAPPLAEAAGDIAVLLPQSGRMSRAAEAIRDGLMAAYYQDSASASDSPTLHFYDSDSAPIVTLLQEARAAGANVVIGPLDRDRVEALIKAGEQPLPVLALNSAEGAAANLAEFALSPDDEIQRLAEWMTRQGIRRPLLLSGADEASQRQLRLFQSAWQAGHPVAPAVVTLDASRKGGIAGAIKELLRSGPKGDALFLASPALARQVQPTLTYYHSALPLYSLASAWDPTADASGLNDLDGLRFCDQPWMLEPQRPEQEALYAAQPRPAASYDRLYAFGADAWTLARAWPALQDGERLSLRSGLVQLDAGHALRRQPTCAEIRNGTAFIIWSPTATPDADGSGG
ncbi:MAG: LppC family lipoprotein [Moraxellaceae bacterium]|jgi:outer membrane PBP1 activator LpoA protein|nr:LppC family lipoprotein [Moraxellaceae bacterium]